MKTSNYLIALAALTSFTLVGCSDNDFIGTSTGPEVAQQGNGEITFTSSSKKLTRGETLTGKTAADRLNNIFVVWGEKNESQADGSVTVNGEAATVPNAGTGAKAAAGDLTFMNYLVTYTDGSAGNTESNSRGWEYVGNTPYASATPMANNQTIKYWDWSANAYTFYGFSAKPEDLAKGNVVAVKTEEATATTGNLNFDKGYTITLNGLASLDDLYFSKRLVITNKKAYNELSDGQPSYAVGDENKVGGVVNLSFQAAAAKIRFGIYETIPGYSVNIDKVYYSKTALINTPTNASGGSTVNFGVNGDFVVPGDGTKLIVTYSPSDAVKVGTTKMPVNTPMVKIEDAAKSGYFETDDAASPWMTDAALGETSNAASFNLTDRAYKAILPNTDNSTDIVLTLDYTLTSTDGSGETIKVYGAQAHVPASFSQWQSNFAYTYLFKITDNTNGHTGTVDPTSGPASLYPITFDAVVLDSEIGDQETITTIANPSITTYQNGSKVVDNNEYKVLAANGDIYITVSKGSNFETLTGKYNLYTAVDLKKDKEDITEAALANYANNDIVLTDVTAAISNATETSISGVTITPALTAGKVVKFTPTAGNTYVFKYDTGVAGVYAYKVIKVEGTPASHTYTIAATDANIAEGGTATITIKEGDNVVTGAQNYIAMGSDKLTAEETTSGTYTITAHEGLEGAVYNVTLAGGKASSNTLALTATSYAFSAASLDVPEDVKAADNKTINIQSKIGTASYATLTSESSSSNFKFVDADGVDYDGLEIADVGAGVVKIKAKDATLADNCKIQYVVGGKVLAEAAINVAKYSFDKPKYYVNKSTNDTPVSTTATVTVANTANSPNGRTVASTDASKATASPVADGKATITPVAKGTTKITLGSASADVEVTQFTIKFYSNFGCTTDGSFANDNYAVFYDNTGAPAYATLKATNCKLERISTPGAYKITNVAAGAKIEYIYNGTTFTLAQ